MQKEEICKVRGLFMLNENRQVLHELFLWDEAGCKHKAEEGQKIRNPFMHMYTHQMK